MEILTATALPSHARTRPPQRPPLRIGAVQVARHPDSDQHAAALQHGIRAAAEAGARLVCLPELTLSPYFAIRPTSTARPEPLNSGPTFKFARRAAEAYGVHVHASLYERADAEDELGYKTAIVVAPDGTLAARTRKLHIPITSGHHENHYFTPGPAHAAFPVHEIAEGCFGFPTCWDQWFPALARRYSLAGAEVLVYPTAIGSEPDQPGFDTRPLWEQVIVANGTFMLAVNRIGSEGHLTFYGSSSSATPTAASSSARRETGWPSSSPISMSISAETGSSCSHSSRPDAPTPTPRKRFVARLALLAHDQMSSDSSITTCAARSRYPLGSAA